MLTKKLYEYYISALNTELVPAFGCTEPIAIALASAKARETLGSMPEKIIVECSANVIKNVKGVVVPGTGGMKGVIAAAAAGAAGGVSSRSLEVLESLTQQELEQARDMIKRGICEERVLNDGAKLHIVVHQFHGDDRVLVDLVNTHTGIARVEKNGEILYHEDMQPDMLPDGTPHVKTRVETIFMFSETVNIDEIKNVLDRQMDYNMKIAKEGLCGNYGVQTGQTIIELYGQAAAVMAKASAAAGVDARMSGCELPVIINSGSGNQGLTVSVPIISYADSMGITGERLYRALCLGNLITIHQKMKIGRLSAYCGVVSASAGAGAGITYLRGGGLQEIEDCITIILANLAGMVCDGAKPSCAAKAASCLDAALCASEMSMKRRTLEAGDGIVKRNIEETIDSVSYMARRGMAETDKTIIEIMTRQVNI